MTVSYVISKIHGGTTQFQVGFWKKTPVIPSSSNIHYPIHLSAPATESPVTGTCQVRLGGEVRNTIARLTSVKKNSQLRWQTWVLHFFYLSIKKWDFTWFHHLKFVSCQSKKKDLTDNIEIHQAQAPKTTREGERYAEWVKILLSA